MVIERANQLAESSCLLRKPGDDPCQYQAWNSWPSVAARSFNSGGYLRFLVPGTTPTFPRFDVSEPPEAIQ